MTGWLADLPPRVAEHGPLIRVVVSQNDGSTPRESGAAMLVTATACDGTIGGGELEFRAIREARALLAARRPDDAPWPREERAYPLGPALGQCCGGHVRLLFEYFDATACGEHLPPTPAQEGPTLFARPVRGGPPPLLLHERRQLPDSLPIAVQRPIREMLSGTRPAELTRVTGLGEEPDWLLEPLAPPLIPLFLYGAGHVGRAVVRAFADLPFAITWIDTARSRFPDRPPDAVTVLPATRPELVAARAPDTAWHVVMTYSHPLDLAICDAVLSREDFAYLGLIGSRTKRARFIGRLRALGHDERRIARLVCPIGLPGLAGKEPAVIAISLAADLLQAVRESATTDQSTRANPG